MEQLEDKAVALLDQGKLRRAERGFKQMLSSDRNCLAAHFHLARIYRRTTQYDLALRHAHRTLRLNPNERNAHLNLGLIYDLMGRTDLAAFHYKKELSRNRDSAETLWNVGRLYFRNHRWLQASKCLRRCFDLGFTFEVEDSVDKLGVCYNRLGSLQSYIEVFTRYVQLFPDASWAFANLGRALLHAKDFKGAVLRLSRANQLGFRKSIAIELAQAKKMVKKRIKP